MDAETNQHPAILSELDPKTHGDAQDGDTDADNATHGQSDARPVGYESANAHATPLLQRLGFQSA